MCDTYDTPPWEEISKKFKFELTYSIPEQRKEREDKILASAKKAYDGSVEMHNRFKEEGQIRALKNESEGWTWFQNKLVDTESGAHHYYTWKIYDKPTLMGLIKKEQSSNLHNVEAVYKSGLFERLDNNKMPGYYEWILKK